MYKIVFLLLLPILAFSRVHITVNFPLEEFFVKKIGQNHVRIKTLSNRYLPTIIDFRPSDFKKFSDSDIYFYFDLKSGKEYAKILKEYNEKIIISNLSSNIKKLIYKQEINPYIWMDPIRVRVIMKNIYNTLVKIDPRHKDDYKMQLDDFLEKIDDVFLKTKMKFFESENYNFFVYDEHWQYYAKRFRLNLYYKEKRYLRANEIKEINEFVEKKNINSIVISPDTSLSITQSISGNSNIKIKTHDIFEPTWYYNISSLTNTLIK